MRIVEEFGLEDSVDTLGRWMAHYIASLMEAAAQEQGEKRDVFQRECFSTILTLWKHRSEWPNGSRPYEDLEPVYRAMASLDPEDNTPRYYRQARSVIRGEVDTSEDQEKWLKFANELDDSAKVLIGYSLMEAARTPIEESKEWAQFAECIIGDSTPEIVLRSFSAKLEAFYKEVDLDEENRLILRDRIHKLQGFIKSSKIILEKLEEQFDSLPKVKND